MIKNYTKQLKTVALCICFLSITANTVAQTEFYNETTDGELSADNTSPSGPFTLVSGGNTITSTQGTALNTANYFTFTIPTDFELTELVLQTYDAAAGNQAFIGLQAGSSFTTDANSTSQSDLLGGLLYSSGNEGNNVLQLIADLSGAQGFTVPLEAGTYTVWLNQTGNDSTSTWNFVVDAVLSVDDNALNNISLYPNPAQDTFKINTVNNAIRNVAIIDVTGRTVQSINGNTTANQEITVSTLTAGIYFANITTDAGVATQRFVKK